ncbi:hypothetical protein [Paenibacillus piri]|uniref:Uncharacterized protein n=1 Tax=Paenibacillus piri TaxID=2547395 RepID=A0A4R5KC61_9BACL|nr:hypothetical protein [Paenibacillus piri]TDF91620.1 hypothetical protein E1757_32315 [Paenibacillus piri]
MLREQQLSKESTVYHYRLLQRIHSNKKLICIYWGLLAVLYIRDLIHIQPFYLLFALIAIPALHTLLICLYYMLKEKRPLSQWTFQYQLPWVGFIPTNYIALRRIIKLHLHILWITVVICGCFFPWLPLDLIARCLIVHVWLMLPRYIVFYRFRRHHESGLLKINKQDTSCYAQ